MHVYKERWYMVSIPTTLQILTNFYQCER